MAQRKEDQDATLKVTFQTGVPVFDFKPITTAAKRAHDFAGGHKYGGGARAGGGKKMTKFQQEQAQNDAFLDDMMGDLDSITNINVEIGKQLNTHTEELSKQVTFPPVNAV